MTKAADVSDFHFLNGGGITDLGGAGPPGELVTARSFCFTWIITSKLPLSQKMWVP